MNVPECIFLTRGQDSACEALAENGLKPKLLKEMTVGLLCCLTRWSFLQIFSAPGCFSDLLHQVTPPACCQPNLFRQKHGGLGCMGESPQLAGAVSGGWRRSWGPALPLWGRRERKDSSVTPSWQWIFPWRAASEPWVGILSLAVDMQSHAVHKEGRTS